MLIFFSKWDVWKELTKTRIHQQQQINFKKKNIILQRHLRITVCLKDHKTYLYM